MKTNLNIMLVNGQRRKVEDVSEWGFKDNGLVILYVKEELNRKGDEVVKTLVQLKMWVNSACVMTVEDESVKA
jgi:hypothetical protein